LSKWYSKLYHFRRRKW